MDHKQELPARQFHVNGTKCWVSLDAQLGSLSWWPANGRQSKCDKRTQCILFDQMLGMKRCDIDVDRKHKSRLKIYFARPNSSKSASQLLQLKKLSIAQTYRLPRATGDNGHLPSRTAKIIPHSRSTGSRRGDSARQFVRQTKQSVSEPPSCYASEGSNSHLSCISSESGTHSVSSSTAMENLACDNRPPESMHDSPSDSSIDRLAQTVEFQLELRRRNRPKKLLVFVNPFGGKGKATHLYKSRVRRLLELANVEVELLVTKYANHARDTIEDPYFNVEYFDGLVCVGGDGMFSELMNGLLFRYNRDKLLAANLCQSTSTAPTSSAKSLAAATTENGDIQGDKLAQADSGADLRELSDLAVSAEQLLAKARDGVGGIGRQFISPPMPVGVIGAGSTDANSFGLIGTNDVITATLNIILGCQIKIDVCSVHTIKEDRPLRFVSTFVAYGYFGDVIRESERLRWLGPSRYDITGVNNLIKNRTYNGLVRALVSENDGSPLDLGRCHVDCQLCANSRLRCDEIGLKVVERMGAFVGVNAAVTACRCPQSKKGFSPGNHLANGCADLILVRPCTRLQYLQYLLRTGYSKKSAFDLKYVEAFRCRQFEFLSQHQSLTDQMDAKFIGSSASATSSSTPSEDQTSNSNSLDSKQSSGHLSAPPSISGSSGSSSRVGEFSSWNVDGEILDERSIRVKVNNQLLKVFGTGEPLHSIY